MSIIYDIKVCRGNTKGLIFIIAFRLSHFFTKNLFFKIIGFPIRFSYKLIFEFLYGGVEIKDTVTLGEGFNLYHGYGTVIERSSVIRSFLELVRLENRICSTKDNIKSVKSILAEPINYNKGSKELARLRNESLDLLKQI